MADNEVIEVGTAKFNSRVAALLPTGSATTNVAVESHNLGVWQHPWVPAL